MVFYRNACKCYYGGKNHNKKKETHIFRQNIRRKYVTIYKKYVNGWGINH